MGGLLEVRLNPVHWDWLIYMAMFSAGVAAGAYLVAALLEAFGRGRSSLARVATTSRTSRAGTGSAAERDATDASRPSTAREETRSAAVRPATSGTPIPPTPSTVSSRRSSASPNRRVDHRAATATAVRHGTRDRTVRSATRITASCLSSRP